MNVLDFIIIAGIALLVGAGFFTGVNRILVAFVATYFATVIAAASYQGLSGGIQRVIDGMSTASADLTAFFLLLGAMATIFYFVVSMSVRKVEDKRGRFSILDNIGGAALAIGVGVLTIAMTLSVATIVIGAFNQASVEGGTNTLGAVGDQIRGSELVPIFIKLQPAINLALRPWFPGGLPSILEPASV